MKLVSWNCNGALRKKIECADALSADVLIVQECEDPERSTQAYREWAGDYIWHGLDKNKGIGVFARNGTKVESLKWLGEYSVGGKPSKSAATWKTDELNLFLPFTVNNEYIVLAVWTKKSDGGVFDYIGQVWKYLQIHRDQLKGDKTIIAGDFNSNVIWDRKDRWWNHSDVVRELGEIGIVSLYHEQTKEPQGKESRPTLYFRKSLNRPYHIDYIFLSKDLLPRSNIDIGEHNKWLAVSDHMPVIAHVTS